MYVGDDVSPDFYGWVFPKYDHVAVGTGTVVNKTAIKQYQTAMRNRAEDKCAGGKSKFSSGNRFFNGKQVVNPGPGAYKNEDVR